MAVDKKNRETQDLERYGVWVKAGPDEMHVFDNSSLDLMDIEDSGHDGVLITEEEEQLLGELQESSLPDFGDFDETFGDDDFERTGHFTEHSVSGTESRDLLQKIEGELTALRAEIRQLKDELTGLRLPPVAVRDQEPPDAGGFFDEVGDETIALTGDELDNILDSADMREQKEAPAESGEKTSFKPAESLPPADEEISLEEETIDLSEGFEDIGVQDLDLEIGDLDLEGTDDLEDPGLTILGSPDRPLDEEEPDTIEIDVPGPDETIDLDELQTDSAEVLSIDDIGDADSFEEITDLDDFGLGDDSRTEIPLIDDESEDLFLEPDIGFAKDIGDDLDVFDEGKMLDIDISHPVEDTLPDGDTGDFDLPIEDIPLEDFGLSDEEEETDVLAESFGDSGTAAGGEIPDTEDVDLESILAGGIEDGELVLTDDVRETAEEPVEVERIGDDELPIEELDLDSFEAVEENEMADTGDLELTDIESIDLSPPDSDAGTEFDEIDDLDVELMPLPDESEALDLNGMEIDVEEEHVSPKSADSGRMSDVEELFEVEVFDEEDLEDLEPLADGKLTKDTGSIPEISLDDEIGEIQTPEEFSLGDDEETLEALEFNLEDDSDEIGVTLPDDDFNELPGTEDVDLDSLEALIGAPDLTGGLDEEIIELPETELPPATNTIAESRKQTGMSLELSSLPGDVKEEIRGVFEYMDLLLDSLPNEKIQEFARSEHYEVYKQIFEVLGIPKDGSA